MSTPADERSAAARRDAQAARDAETQLWWSDRGRIACAEHLPAPGSAAWWADRWELADPAWLAGYAGSRGELPRCEACVALEQLARRDGAS